LRNRKSAVKSLLCRITRKPKDLEKRPNPGTGLEEKYVKACGGDKNQGRAIETKFSYTYEVDLDGVGENATEKDLAELIQFQDGGPEVTIKFVNP